MSLAFDIFAVGLQLGQHVDNFADSNRPPTADQSQPASSGQTAQPQSPVPLSTLPIHPSTRQPPHLPAAGGSHSLSPPLSALPQLPLLGPVRVQALTAPSS
ncbi:unnamed protein product [Protopolystoma xenopodis]|uniref:Uncharacterized protein n=1 Tax=Protopolystoma xenopodis TaxID=117903 RepID=A0A448XSK9_9PLAT|nr:unnamed protein product [Protopolystoma xenopodis]